MVSIFLAAQVGLAKKADKEEAPPKTVVAILPFNNNSPGREDLDVLGTTLSDLISAEMAGHKEFKVVERLQIETLLKEQKLGLTGVIDATTAVQIGKIIGANVMAFGSYLVIGKKVLLTMRLVRVETGEIIRGKNLRGNDVSDLDVLAEKAAKELTSVLRREAE